MTSTITHRFTFLLLFVCGILLCTCYAKIISGNYMTNVGGSFRFTYDNERVHACQNVVLLGVGTAMSVSNYTMVARSIATGHSIVVIIMDHSPRFIIKTSATKFARTANAIVASLSSKIPACASTIKPSKIAIGGHSASGQAAWNSISFLTFKLDGFVGLDPFDLEKSSHIEIPTINFGFSKTTCNVKTEQSAEAGYNKSNSANRVLFKIYNMGLQLNHCSFADRGCPMCPAGEGSHFVRETVGKGINLFFKSLHSHVYNRHVYAMGASPQLAVTVFVNSDQVLKKNTAATKRTTGNQCGPLPYSFKS